MEAPTGVEPCRGSCFSGLRDCLNTLYAKRPEFDVNNTFDVHSFSLVALRDLLVIQYQSEIRVHFQAVHCVILYDNAGDGLRGLTLTLYVRLLAFRPLLKSIFLISLAIGRGCRVRQWYGFLQAGPGDQFAPYRLRSHVRTWLMAGLILRERKRGRG